MLYRPRPRIYPLYPASGKTSTSTSTGRHSCQYRHCGPRELMHAFAIATGLSCSQRIQISPDLAVLAQETVQNLKSDLCAENQHSGLPHLSVLTPSTVHPSVHHPTLVYVNFNTEWVPRIFLRRARRNWIALTTFSLFRSSSEWSFYLAGGQTSFGTAHQPPVCINFNCSDCARSVFDLRFVSVSIQNGFPADFRGALNRTG